MHGVPSLGIPVVHDHGAGKRPGDHDHGVGKLPGDHDYGVGVRVMHDDATRDPGLHDSGTGELPLETAWVCGSGNAGGRPKALLILDVGEVHKGYESSSEQEEFPYSSEDECWSDSESSCFVTEDGERVSYACLMMTHGGDSDEEGGAADLGIGQPGTSASRGAVVQSAPGEGARIGPGDRGCDSYDESPAASAGPQTGSSGQDTSSSTTRASTSSDEDQQRAIDAMPEYIEEMNRVWGIDPTAARGAREEMQLRESRELRRAEESRAVQG